MDQNPRPKSLIDSVGEEIIRIVTPVSICMLLVVILVTVLSDDSESLSSSMTTVAAVAYTEDSSDSTWDKLKGAYLVMYRS